MSSSLTSLPSVFTLWLRLLPLLLSLTTPHVHGVIPTTLEGPFKPVTVPMTQYDRGTAIDLPATDPRVQRNVTGFEPEQIFVTLSYSYDSVYISWITGEFQIGYNIKPLDPKSVASVVFFGECGSKLNRKASGYSLIYNQLYPFPGLQNYTSGIIHHVQLKGLKPNTTYEYQCGDPSIPAMSKVYQFRTMPVSGPKSYLSRIAIVGDFGLTYNTTSTVDHIISNKPDLLVYLGDMSYADLYVTNGTLADSSIEETYQPRWDYWGRYMGTWLSRVPSAHIEGNHEIEPQVHNHTFAAYMSRFVFPTKESGSNSPFYYSFNAGGIHFIMLGAYVPYNKTSPQYKWLVRDLMKVDRKVTPWLIATMHPPWYTTYAGDFKSMECMRQSMEAMLYEYGVDVVFNGHVHAYERTNRVFNYTLDPCAPLYITVGDGGNHENLDVGYADDPGNCPAPLSTPDTRFGGFCAYNYTSGPAKGQFCWNRQPDYSAIRESSFGHGILEVKNETHALWTWHRNQDAYGVGGDAVYIVRQPEKCPIPRKI